MHCRLCDTKRRDLSGVLKYSTKQREVLFLALQNYLKIFKSLEFVFSFVYFGGINIFTHIRRLFANQLNLV